MCLTVSIIKYWGKIESLWGWTTFLNFNFSIKNKDILKIIISLIFLNPSRSGKVASEDVGVCQIWAHLDCKVISSTALGKFCEILSLFPSVKTEWDFLQDFSKCLSTFSLLYLFIVFIMQSMVCEAHQVRWEFVEHESRSSGCLPASRLTSARPQIPHTWQRWGKEKEQKMLTSLSSRMVANNGFWRQKGQSWKLGPVF